MIASPIKGVFTDELRHAHMQLAIETHLSFIEKQEEFHDRTISIVGYGPSLLHTWKDITHPIIATSGAYDFLADRMADAPDYYVAIDPRESTLDLLQWPEEETTYLMASVCHPAWWEKLAGYHVVLWHLINDEHTMEWVAWHHPEGLYSMIGGDSTVGQRAFNVAAALGYRKFNVFGLDFSFEKTRHAGPHNAERQPELIVPYRGKAYATTPQWQQAAKEMLRFITTCDIEITFHGDGLMQDLAKGVLDERRKLV